MTAQGGGCPNRRLGSWITPKRAVLESYQDFLLLRLGHGDKRMHASYNYDQWTQFPAENDKHAPLPVVDGAVQTQASILSHQQREEAYVVQLGRGNGASSPSSMHIRVAVTGLSNLVGSSIPSMHQQQRPLDVRRATMRASASDRVSMG
ncbi:hypothetical protein SNOG_07422 [Parastagonospora nodorum SN15]|uniref:Uncharacterized protein n=1 Tax=Phaeosphaeria nodorum (strain SN15 / ATCC MYA-4574 / FGSC 10173) TaxID=321614 RepID=Q0ULE2_PHANO|nr:hypothetical protein SNOG_07422 [Parastagonospora nodorum SN15]EAT84888.1 hypothetical protein SNOG_07422 [Parastagonospora nodorum SN15]